MMKAIKRFGMICVPGIVSLFCLFSFKPVNEKITPAPIKFEVKFSEPFAVWEFVQKLTDKAPPNPFKEIFSKSEYNTEKYKDLIATYTSIPLSYHYDFPDYPYGEKMEANIIFLLKTNLINSQNLDDFKIRSLGLIPMSDLNKIIQVIEGFKPVYQQLIYEPAKIIFEKQVKDIAELVNTKNIGTYFEQARIFYNSSWDASVPIVFVFYPLPNSQGFTAMTYHNIALSAIPTSLTNYNALLTVLLHEMCHILYDERSLSIKQELNKWFTSSLSEHSAYAHSLVDEALATAVGNGFFNEKMSGKLNSGNWYNRKYISRMAKAIYPKVKEYLDGGIPFDKTFIDHYQKTYVDSFAYFTDDLDFLLTGRAVITENRADFDVIDQKFPYGVMQEYLNDFSDNSFEKLKKALLTRVIVVSADHKKKLTLIKNHFSELKGWKPDPTKDFTYVQLLNDRRKLIVINLVQNSLEKQLGAWGVK